MDGFDSEMKVRLSHVKKGFKFGASLLKSTIREVAEVASGVPSPTPSSNSRSSRQNLDTLQEGPALVHYHLQAPKDAPEDVNNCFLISQEERAGGVTKGLIRRLFPIKGNYVLRFKTSDSTFGHIWTDLQLDTDLVPLYMGQIEVRVFRLPENTPQRSHPPMPPVTTPASKTPAVSHAGQSHKSPGPCASGAVGGAMPDLLFDSMHSGPKATSPGVKPKSPFSPSVPSTPMASDNFAKLESRDQIRKKNEDRIQEKAQAAADVVTARGKAEDEARAAKHLAAETLAPLLDKWAFNPDSSLKDCRTLLGTIPDVMWANCTFTPTSVPELMMSSAKVKRAYRSCIVVFHPDKHQGAEADIVYRAERIFQHVNDAWDIMRKKESG